MPGAHEPLIGAQAWAAYQRRRESQRQMPSKARSPHWSLAGIAVCGSCGGPVYCSSSQRGPNYALYCGTQRTSGACSGSYRTRAPVEAAVALWLERYAAELEAATMSALKTLPAPQATAAAYRLGSAAAGLLAAGAGLLLARRLFLRPHQPAQQDGR